MFQTFTTREALIRKFSENITISDFNPPILPANVCLISQSIWLENARITSYISTLAVTNTDNVDNLDDPNQIKSALLDILFHSARKQLDIKARISGITTKLGSLSLINNGFPYNYHNLGDIINQKLSLNNVTDLIFDFVDVGYGVMIPPDYCLLQGDIVRDLTIFYQIQNQQIFNTSPIISIPTPTINLDININGSVGPAPEPEPDPEPEPEPEPIIEEDLMRILRQNAWYINIPGEMWNWWEYQPNYLSISPFIVESGYKLKSIGLLIDNCPSGTYQITYPQNNFKYAIWDDNVGKPNFANKLANGILIHTREENYDVKFISSELPTPIDKRLVWVGIKAENKIYKTRAMSNNGGDYDLMGFIFPDNITDYATWQYTTTGYAVVNCLYSEDWQADYPTMIEVNGDNNFDNNLIVLGQLIKI